MLEDMLEANRLVLEDIDERIDGDVGDSEVEGRVVIEEGATLKGCRVRGPAVIARRRHARELLHRPLHRDRRGRRRQGLRDRALDRALGLAHHRPARPDGAQPAGQGRDLTRSDGMPKTMQFLVGDKAEIAIP